MWLQLLFAVTIIVIFLFLPGFLFFRTLRISHFESLACAPLFSMLSYTMLAIAYEKYGISTAWDNLFFPLVAFCSAVFALSRLFGKRSHEPMLHFSATEGAKMQQLVPLLYVLIGVIAGTFIFLRSLDSAASFLQEYDNCFHLGLIRSFTESGNWSILATSVYPASANTPADPFSITSFYPASWHIIAAMPVSALNVPIAIAENASVFVFAFIVFPLSMWLFLDTIFHHDQRLVLLGAFTTMGFASFPWIFSTFGPLYPNLSAYSMMPAVAAFFIRVLSPEKTAPSRGACLIALFVGFPSIAATHPNSIFSFAIVLAPYCAYLIASRAETLNLQTNRKRMLKRICVFLFVAFCIAIWTLLYYAPFLQGAVTHLWAPFASLSQAIQNALLLSPSGETAQPVMGLLVIAGMLLSARMKDYRWLSISMVIVLLIYCVCATTDGFLKSYLAGFWYTDASRIMATAFLCGIPLATLGLSLIVKVSETVASQQTGKRIIKRGSPLVIATVVFSLVVYSPCFLYPDEDSGVYLGLSRIASDLQQGNSLTSSPVYDLEEMRFVEEAIDLLPEGAIIINEPNDGTGFAYGADGLNVLYRRLRDYDTTEGEKRESILIRKNLNEIATNPEVAKAVRSFGAEYLIQLDNARTRETEEYLFSYDPDEWVGIDSVTRSTPGFEVILEREDMTLYRIRGV